MNLETQSGLVKQTIRQRRHLNKVVIVAMRVVHKYMVVFLAGVSGIGLARTVVYIFISVAQIVHSAASHDFVQA